MKTPWIAALVLFFCLGAPAKADVRVIVRANGGVSAVNLLCQLAGCTVVRALEDPLNRLFLVTMPNLLNPLGLLSSLSLTVGGITVELDLPLNLIPSGAASNAPSWLQDLNPVSYFGDPVSNGYAWQPASNIVNAHTAHLLFATSGRTTTVAVIDTGVDSSHPALSRVVVPGYDFVKNEPGMANEALVNQSTAAVLDGGSPTKVNSQTIALVDQSTAAVLDDPNKRAHGHGTMVAGIIHMTAPDARIASLRAFSPDGSGNLSEILRAIYWAARSNVRVINMSFSMSSYSKELEKATDYAVSRQILCVSSAGNGGSNTPVYPAALGSVVGVGSTGYTDQRSSFSNYGSFVSLAAPGEAIVSAYPNGTYAAGWGTSFSTPFVAGAAALLFDLSPAMTPGQVTTALSNATPVGQGLGAGRLDIVRAINSTR